jgi:hypothetical protein
MVFDFNKLRILSPSRESIISIKTITILSYGPSKTLVIGCGNTRLDNCNLGIIFEGGGEPSSNPAEIEGLLDIRNQGSMCIDNYSSIFSYTESGRYFLNHDPGRMG